MVSRRGQTRLFAFGAPMTEKTLDVIARDVYTHASHAFKTTCARLTALHDASARHTVSERSSLGTPQASGLYHRGGGEDRASKLSVASVLPFSQNDGGRGLP